MAKWRVAIARMAVLLRMTHLRSILILPFLAACGGNPLPATDAAPDVASVAPPTVFSWALATFRSCLHRSDGPWCWGALDARIAGMGAITDVPTRTPELDDATQVAMGAYHACARYPDATSRCWGDNTDGRLGDATGQPYSTPTIVADLRGVVKVAVGRGHSCALLDDGTVRCWGRNQSGELGDGTTSSHGNPTVVTGLSDVRDIACSGDNAQDLGVYAYTCALLGDKTVHCWGGGVTQPTEVAKDIARIAVGTWDICTEDTAGDVRCWQLISRDHTAVGLGPAFPDVAGALEIVQGTHHGCALMPGGTVKCWGGNDNGQVGIGATSFRVDKPTTVALDRVVHLAVGGYHTCALRDDDSVHCWGYGFYGEVGDGVLGNHPTPTAIKF